MVGDGLPVYGTRSSEVPLSDDDVVRLGSLPSLYVDAWKVAEVIEGRKSDPPSVKNSRLERLAELLTGAGKGPGHDGGLKQPEMRGDSLGKA